MNGRPDIIERLARHAEITNNALGIETALGRLLREAADEIEALRGKAEEAAEMAAYTHGWDVT